jgi:hypothetical protein
MKCEIKDGMKVVTIEPGDLIAEGTVYSGDPITTSVPLTKEDYELLESFAAQKIPK